MNLNVWMDSIKEEKEHLDMRICTLVFHAHQLSRLWFSVAESLWQLFVCVHVWTWMCVQVPFQMCTQGFCQEHGSSGRSRFSRSLLSNVFLLCFSHQRLNWGEKWTRKHQSGERKIKPFLSLCLVPMQLSYLLVFCYFFFAASATGALMVSDPRIKCGGFSCQNKSLSHSTSCHEKPSPILQRVLWVLWMLLCGCPSENIQCLIKSFCSIMIHFNMEVPTLQKMAIM